MRAPAPGFAGIQHLTGHTPAIDMRGQRIGRLVVTGPAASRGSDAHWRAVCDCGTEVIRKGFDLRRSMRLGVESACKPCAARIRNDKVGRTTVAPGHVYGRLTVVALASMDANGAKRWLCRCECGSECTRLQASFKRPRKTPPACDECLGLARREVMQPTRSNGSHTPTQGRFCGHCFDLPHRRPAEGCSGCGGAAGEAS